MRIVGCQTEKITLSKATCCAENIGSLSAAGHRVSGGVAKIVTLGFVIVIKATSSKLSWISMNTGVIPDPGSRHGDKDKDKYDNRLILLIIFNNKLPMRM